MHIKAAAAILLIDQLTGRPITDGSAFVEVEDRTKPIRKQDGYFVLLHHGNMHPVVTVGGGIYEKKVLTLDIEEIWQKKTPDLKVYLTPGKQYPFPPGIRWQNIQKESSPEEIKAGEAGSFFPAVWEMTKGAVKLIRNYDKEERNIWLKAVGGLSLEGRMLAFRSKERNKESNKESNKKGNIEETGLIWEALDSRNGMYLLHRPMGAPYCCGDTDIFLTYETRADEHGSYQIPAAMGGD